MTAGKSWLVSSSILLMPGLDNTRLFMRITAGAGTRSMVICLHYQALECKPLLNWNSHERHINRDLLRFLIMWSYFPFFFSYLLPFLSLFTVFIADSQDIFAFLSFLSLVPFSSCFFEEFYDSCVTFGQRFYSPFLC